jgi:phage terminase Nu1 subunit (DNA packaging protein)
MSLIPSEFTMSALSVELGIGQRTLARKIGALPPHRTDGRRRYWRLAAVLSHLEREGGAREGKLDPAQERARLDRARRQRAELDAAVRRGELVESASVAAAAFSLARGVRDAILSVPSRLASILAAESNAARVEARMTDELRAALAMLAADSDPASGCLKSTGEATP